MKKIILSNYCNQNIQKREWITILFLAASIFTALLLAQAIILAYIGQFKLNYILISVLISSVASSSFIPYLKKEIKLFPVITIPALLVILLVSSLIFFFPHDSFGGRDEGFYSGIAVYLANNGSLNVPAYIGKTSITVIDSIKIYPPAYTRWLALQEIFFGSQWLLRSNLILVSLGLFSFFLVASFVGSKVTGIMSVLLLSSSMPFLWFARETMSENLSFFLLWTSILFLLISFRCRRIIFLIISFLTMWLAALTRFEQFFSQFLLIFVSFFLGHIFKGIPLKRIIFANALMLMFILLAIVKINSSSYQVYLNDVLPLANSIIKKDLISFRPVESIKKDALLNTGLKLKDQVLVFFPLMLAKYNLFIIIFSIFLSGFVIFLSKKTGRGRKIYFFCILIILAPEFLKLVNPRVTLEQPWMYRRYLYALLPLGYMGLVIILQKITSRKLLLVSIFLLLTLNLLLSGNTITLKNNWPITEKIKELTQNISQNDFVIIKDLTVVSNYYPIAYLSYQRTILSEFLPRINKQDFDPKEKKFKGVDYNKLYLLSDKDTESLPNFDLKRVSSVRVNSQQLVPNCYLVPLHRIYDTNDNYSLPFLEVMNLCKNIENEIAIIDKPLFLYELTYQEN